MGDGNTDSDPRQFTLTSPDGSIIARGSMSAVMERLPDTHARNDAIESMYRVAADAVEAEERQQEARASAVQMISDAVAHLTNRMDAYISRREAQRQADAEEAAREEQEQIQNYLDQLPDPDGPDTHIPTGDLHDLPAPEDPEGSALHATPREEDDQGLTGLAETRPITSLEELAHGPPQPTQPIAIQLNEE
jgi:hypothetical protein